MTTPLIEAMTRAMPRDIDYLWRKACAQAALTAITEAGFVCVSREPTQDTLDAMREAGWVGGPAEAYHAAIQTAKQGRPTP